MPKVKCKSGHAKQRLTDPPYFKIVIFFIHKFIPSACDQLLDHEWMGDERHGDARPNLNCSADQIIISTDEGTFCTW
ncbi:MAG: hypothetical protein COT81_05275 [Candidatus Buchananbacteria bacterium CG10_big_fil_rev_8_21_14_0_10_42_9]|uniref:Uncharacterized protein n=1 Tax=Candidatus Buchananbacteria bacterium CG10_big_fil_rev_8_21_14_0_10_42_9 TaxID=1974526 RepID=A0A2H0VZZ4_9BACT|nr:MAG: hypothetical protein COT81_05275 [Candidatus Buchananbacteria bacterium CG10_big_fil_rev_8_21_14_0_10_42_9]